MNVSLSLLLIWCMACTPPTATEESITSDRASSDSATLIEEGPHSELQKSGPDVYVTKDGDKYHTADCKYSKTASPAKLSQAKAEGKTACVICKPNSKSGEKQVRCSGTTAEGKRCQRLTTDLSARCFQHRDS